MKFAHTQRRGKRSTARPDLNLSALADWVGVDAGYLSRLFRGMGTPSVPLAQRLAKSLGVPLTQLLEELDKEREKGKTNGTHRNE